MPDFPSETSASGITKLKKHSRLKQSGNWPPPLAGLGGTVTKGGGYVTHTFTTSGVFTPITSAPLVAEYLVVAGGGGGGDVHGGGGGAGGFLTGTFNTVPLTAYPVVVGGGGVGGYYEGAVGTPSGAGVRGTDSSITTVVTANGGGGGGTYDNNPTGTFGSGGGGAGKGLPGLAGTTGQGNSGGSGLNPGGGGGGGAGLPGSNADNGNGGNGLQFPIYPNGWSAYFDGSGDYLSASSNAAFALPGNFTVEAWVYVIANSSADGSNFRNAVIASTQQNGPTDGFTFQINGSSTITGTSLGAEFRVGGVNTGYSSTTVNIPQNTWNHIAFVRSGTTITYYLNGINIGTSTASQNIPTGGALTIGGQTITNYNRNLNGYISNLRIVKDTALYTSNFIPSTQPLTAVSGTSLLTCQSNTIRDNSSNSFTVTASGNAIVEQFGPFNANEIVTSYSTYFDGNGDYLSLPSGSMDFIHQGVSSWTFETWFYTTSTAYQTLFSTTGSTAQIGFNIAINNPSIGSIFCQINRGSSGNDYYTSAAAGSFSINVWNHLVVTFNGSTKAISIYLNGISLTVTTSGTATFSASTATNLPNIGRFLTASVGAGGYFVGNISNLRVIQNSILYTTNFIPPTQPLTAITSTSLLTCQDNVVRDNSLNNFAITAVGGAIPTLNSPFGMNQVFTSYSAYFDGTGDYLTIPGNAALSLGSGDYTVEAWVYLTGTQTTSYGWGVFGTFAGAGNGWSLTINQSNNGQSVRWIISNAVVANAPTPFIPLTTWTHIAVTRSGTGTNNTKIFINGVLSGQATDNTNDTFTGTLYIGGQGTGQLLTGYISNARLVKGTALYTANFTPPRSPLTAIANTSLLTCQDNIFIDKSTNNFAITATGNATLSLANPFLEKTYYAGGGGGAWSAIGGPVTLGGKGGGGNGAWDDDTISAGLANTGGGGGATRSNNTSTRGSSGGSGIVVIRYPFESTIQAPRNLTATFTSSTSLTISFTEPISDLPIKYYTVIRNPGNIITTTNSTTLNITGLTANTAYIFTVFATNLALVDSPSVTTDILYYAIGESVYTTPGTYSWTAPANVTSVCAVCVGAGGGYNSTQSGGGGGGLGWKNNIAVVPGQSYTVFVGSASINATGQDSWFVSTSTVRGQGGQGRIGGGWVGDGGGSGGTAPSTSTYGIKGGAGAGGYTGNGGDRPASSAANGLPGQGGGGGSGAENSTSGYAGGGGGVGLYGQGASGAGGVCSTNTPNTVGRGGSGGTDGVNGGAAGGNGGVHGGGGSGGYSGGGGVAGGSGGVRIIWGPGRSYPTNAA